MKRKPCLSLAIILLVIFVGCTSAQTSSQKAISSEVSTIINQMPANDSQQRDQFAAELVEMNPEATIILAEMLLPPDNPNDNSALYGLSALTHYISRNGTEKERAIYSKALMDALEIIQDKQNKAFLIEQIQLVGKAEAVEPLAVFLKDEYLCDYAARALLTIGVDSVEQVFLRVMDSVDSMTRPTIIKALGELRSKSAAAKIAGFASSSDMNTRETALYALANIGDPASDPILKSACNIGNDFEQIKHLSQYLLYARRLAENGNSDLCETICNSVIKAPESPEHVRAAAKETLQNSVAQAPVDFISLSNGKGLTGPMNTLTAKEKAEGFVSLFNGTDLTGWVGSTDTYGVKDGVIFCRKGTGRNIYTEKEYDNFVLRFEFKLQPGSNNGLGIRTPTKGNPAYIAMELQILDNTAEKYSNLHDYQYHGSIYGVVPADKTKRYSAFKPVGEWNYEEVIADGNHIIVKVNGQTIVDADIKEAARNGTVDGKDHPGLFNKTGHIGFLGHGDYLEFRNIRIKEILD